MYNIVSAIIQRECGLRKTTPQAFSQEFFGSRLAMQQIKHRCLLIHPLESMTFNSGGDLICAATEKELLLYDWKFNKVLNTFYSKKFKHFIRMKSLDNVRNEVDIISLTFHKSIVRTHIDPSGNVEVSNLFTADVGKDLSYTLVPQSSDEIIISVGGTISSIDLRCAANSNQSNVHKISSVRSVDGFRFWIQNIIHHPFKPEICVYGHDCNLFVYDKRYYKTQVAKICLQDENDNVNFIYQCSYNYNGNELLVKSNTHKVCLIKNNDRGDIIRSFRGHYDLESCFFGPKSNYIISSDSRAETPKIEIRDKNTGELLNDTPALRFNDDYSGNFGRVRLLGPSVFPHPKLPVIAVLGGGIGASIWSLANNF